VKIRSIRPSFLPAHITGGPRGNRRRGGMSALCDCLVCTRVCLVQSLPLLPLTYVYVCLLLTHPSRGAFHRCCGRQIRLQTAACSLQIVSWPGLLSASLPVKAPTPGRCSFCRVDRRWRSWGTLPYLSILHVSFQHLSWEDVELSNPACSF